MAAPEHNQNALKPEGEAATKVLHAAITPTDKGLFNLAAKEWAKENRVNDGRGVLTMWAITILRAAVPEYVREMHRKLKEEQERKEREISKQKQ